MLSYYLAKLEVRICGNLQKKSKIVLYLTKTGMSLVTCLNIVTILAVRLLPAHIRENAHSIRQLHSQ